MISGDWIVDDNPAGRRKPQDEYLEIVVVLINTFVEHTHLHALSSEFSGEAGAETE